MKGVRPALAVVIAGLSVVFCSSCGPHMDEQPSIHAFEQTMPPMPANAVPTTGSPSSITAKQAKLKQNPLPASRRNLENGKIYYGYYCLTCHGEKGDGQGPVGVAYVPEAADLRSARVKSFSDGELYKKMLTGPGHDPVMQQTVFPDQRWPLVVYVRSLGKLIR
jgi:mono/diheme cytochrome c family protein